MDPCNTPFPKQMALLPKPKIRISLHPLYKELLEKILAVEANVDSAAPNFKTDSYLKPRKLIEDFKRFKGLVDENIVLLEKVNKIDRTTGRTENYNRLDGVYESKLPKTVEQISQYEKENLALAQRLLEANGKLPTRKQLLEDWRKNLEVIRYKAKFPIVLHDLAEEDIISKAAADPNRPLIYLDLAQKNGRPFGRLIIILFYDVVPEIVKNFIKLCENAKLQMDAAKDPEIKKPHILGTSIYRIFPGLYLEGGDMIHGNGCGGMAAGNIDFAPDNFDVDHDCIGTLAMTPNSEGKINSLFTISFKPLNVLNGKRAAFGRVIKGLKILNAIQSFGSKNGKTKMNIVITGCGLLSKSFEFE